MKIDAATKRWTRNASDEKAAASGCRFDESRGQFVIDWAAKYLRLYEGDQAGEPLIARDWQVEATMRLFGWVRPSDRWKRNIRRFTKASFWAPKKSKKSPSLAWWGLYLLCADGEMGQKVYFCAKDGSQAREIAGKHAIEMVQASDELSAECTINKSLTQITHEPTRSILKPLSSADSRTAKAKEGLNGCIFVDEVHVVDRAFMNRVNRAGISRSEPLQVEVSTTGDDLEGYGKSQYDWGKLVESGAETDERFLFLTYEAPAGMTDADLAADPIKYGKIANPAWGHTIDQEEFLEDYNRSKASTTDLAEFKMYRLNVWLSASRAAIRPEDWDACKQSFDIAELLGRDCYAALDLGFKWDTSCLALWFPWDAIDDEPTFRLLTMFWLPEFAATKERSQVRWSDWSRRGDVTITEGDTADFPLIKRAIVECSKKYNIVQLNYDERFAQVLCQQLQDDHHLTVAPFAQNPTNFNEPCRSFEQVILDRRVAHLGNLVMDWQAGNITFKERNGLVMPAKPEGNRLARIDGPVAAIMGLDSALQATNTRSIYSTAGNLEL